MAKPELVVRTDPTPAEIDFLEERLYEFNSRATGIFDAVGLAMFGRDDSGEVVAGLCGHTWGGCCEIRQVWVDGQHRGQGIGRRLLGFEVVDSLPDYPRGHQHLRLRKVLER